MLRFHHVDCEALAPWIDRLDPIEVDLCGLLQSMSKDDPDVREFMHWGFFGFTTGYIHGCMPWVKINSDNLGRRIKHMCQMKLMVRPKRKWFLGTKQIRLVRFSTVYWDHFAMVNRRADGTRTRAREYSVAIDGPRPSQSTEDHYEVIREEGAESATATQVEGIAPRASRGAVAPPEETVTPEEGLKFLGTLLEGLAARDKAGKS